MVFFLFPAHFTNRTPKMPSGIFWVPRRTTRQVHTHFSVGQGSEVYLLFPYGSPKKITSELLSSDVIFLSKPQAWYEITRQRVWNRQRRMASRASVYTRLPAAWFHTRLRRNSIPRQAADSIHAFGVIWMRKENDMAKNLLLEYSEKLACEIAALCNDHKIDSNTRISNQKILIKCFRQHFRSSISSKSCRYAI